MKVSVIVPSYERPKMLKKCINSLRKQTIFPNEIVVVLRTTDSNSRKMVRGLKKHSSTNLLTQALITKPGIIPAMNKGLEAASGDILCFIDDDAVALSNWIEKILSHYRHDPKVGGVGGPCIPIEDGEPIVQQAERCVKTTWYGKNIGNADKVPPRVVEADALRGCNMSFRSGLIEGFDENLIGGPRYENEASFQVLKKNFKILFDPEVRVHHYLAPSKEPTEETREKTKEVTITWHHNNTYVMLKHLPFWQKVIFLLFTFLIGDSPNPGILRYIGKSVLKGGVWGNLREAKWAFSGKMLGISTYLEVRKDEEG